MKKFGVNDFLDFARELVNVGLLTEDIYGQLLNASSEYASQTAKKKEPKTGALWEAYKTCYESRYQLAPLDGPRVRSQLLQLTRQLSKEDAVGLIQYYFMRSDAWYLQNKHPIGFLVKDIQKLYTEWKTGDIMSRKQAQKQEIAQTNVIAAKKYWDKKHGI